MDDIYLYIIGGVVIAILVIIVNKKRQNNRVTDFLKDAGDVQPVFMQQAIEKKLKTLKIALYGNTSSIQFEAAVLDGDALTKSEARKQFLKDELDQLEKNYVRGGVTLKVYDDQLHQLIMQLSE